MSGLRARFREWFFFGTEQGAPDKEGVEFRTPRGVLRFRDGPYLRGRRWRRDDLRGRPLDEAAKKKARAKRRGRRHEHRRKQQAVTRRRTMRSAMAKLERQGERPPLPPPTPFIEGREARKAAERENVARLEKAWKAGKL